MMSIRNRNRAMRDLLPRDPLFRLLLINGAIGAVISVGVAAALLALDIGQLRTLIQGAEDPVVPIMMLVIGLVVTLGSVVMGSAVMMLRSDQDSQGGGHRQIMSPPHQIGRGPAFQVAPVRHRGPRSVRA